VVQASLPGSILRCALGGVGCCVADRSAVVVDRAAQTTNVFLRVRVRVRVCVCVCVCWFVCVCVYVCGVCLTRLLPPLSLSLLRLVRHSVFAQNGRW
jgi:hypothetical protein